ncbi:hypothetical protein JHK82_014948 [Glycine max]|nr:hypothetical protein JHK82_014948 [Glycine max]
MAAGAEAASTRLLNASGSGIGVVAGAFGAFMTETEATTARLLGAARPCANRSETDQVKFSLVNLGSGKEQYSTMLVENCM